MGSCQPCHPGPPLLGSPRAAVGVTAGAHRDLRKPLFLQAAVAKAWLIHKDICKCREPFTVWLVHARQSERGIVSGHMTGTEEQNHQHATQQTSTEWVLCARHVHRGQDAALMWLWVS